ncbi:MAG: Dabb family protein [Gaiellales bacterium]
MATRPPPSDSSRRGLPLAGRDGAGADRGHREGELPGLIPELRRYAFGPDAGLREGNADFAVVAEVDDEDAWRRYSEHPAHQRVLSDWIGPVLEERSAVQLRRG